MTNKNIHPIILTILDGWGIGLNNNSNAIYLAKTPVMDTIQEVFPMTKLSASGLDVGLPSKQVGNSEVGHTTIGGGRIILQDLVKITKSIEDKTFYNNKVLNTICKQVNTNKSKIHIIGLCSDGGVHSHINHLLALLDLIHEKKVIKVCIHFIADGRDTKAKCANEFIQMIQKKIEELGIGQICTISGRYYAMDRDCRWSRTEAFYKILTENNDIDLQEASKVLESFYEQDISDEFIIPTRINEGVIEDNDGIILFNFRPDRMRQLCQAFCKESFKGFSLKSIKGLELCSFTQYDSTLTIPIAFQANSKINFLGEIISRNQLKQLRIAETEKYAHVTYFLNGGIEEPFNGEDRELISSPQVATYDESPLMSASQITKRVTNALAKNIYSLIIINYANPDMVGHTGNMDSTIKAIESVDKEINILLQAIHQAEGTMIITADHGNAEYMLDKNNLACKSHTTNLVPFIMVNHGINESKDNNGCLELRSNGSLADIAPTIIDLLRLDQPKEMTGTSLIAKSNHEYAAKIKV
uniref:2,3-bisphosphoglycerate-independent phosphoglycerate mutase n=1 Tax=Helminthora furcellata TaxID=1884666 RepID=A0A1G4NR13_9FLOR|nr:Phosphoglycerate mutase [Helminthora furcellata]SCW21091.1 Phosphoglycerate mutase [Helminthora furcellata]SCW23951.1 Phosphoglycerate mutase [Helminthora furcellata]